MHEFKIVAVGLMVPYLLSFIWFYRTNQPPEEIVEPIPFTLERLCTDFMADPSRYSEVEYDSDYLQEIHDHAMNMNPEWNILGWILYFLCHLTIAFTIPFALPVIRYLRRPSTIEGFKETCRDNAILGVIGLIGAIVNTILFVERIWKRICPWIETESTEAREKIQ